MASGVGAPAGAIGVEVEVAGVDEEVGTTNSAGCYFRLRRRRDSRHGLDGLKAAPAALPAPPRHGQRARRRPFDLA